MLPLPSAVISRRNGKWTGGEFQDPGELQSPSAGGPDDTGTDRNPGGILHGFGGGHYGFHGPSREAAQENLAERRSAERQATARQSWQAPGTGIFHRAGLGTSEGNALRRAALAGQVETGDQGYHVTGATLANPFAAVGGPNPHLDPTHPANRVLAPEDAGYWQTYTSRKIGNPGRAARLGGHVQGALQRLAAKGLARRGPG